MKHAFDKFINKEKNSKKKEAIRTEKRKWREERRKKFDEQNKKYQKFDERKQAFAGNTEEQNYQPVSTRQNAVSQKYQPEKNKPSIQKKNKTDNSSGNFHSSALPMPLNKFIAHAGVCGRREAAELVKEGKIKVNNKLIHEPGFKVTAADKIMFNNKRLYIQKNLVYILLNKPKDYITTLTDTHGRKTVFELLKHATDERIYPVGRLDRNTTGVLLLTNDGELTQKLTHPSFEIKKIYEVKLDKLLQKKDLEFIKAGINLEDGFVTVDAIGYADAKDKSLIGIEIHSGKNRIVRRIFKHFGYEVKNLDRVLFANLTKKNVERGKWRFLNEKEVRLLKYMNQSFTRKNIEQNLKRQNV